ncbi:MAG: hypothetical protein ABSB94_10880 [Syntrophorhabdales bacterium]|jgi:hypothetical protein
MAILFAQYWDVMENKEKAYEDFILGKYIPTFEKTGLRIAGAYYVVVGKGPRITSVSTPDDLSSFQKAITSEEYSDLLEELFPLIRNYSSKLYKSYGPIRVDRYELRLGVWKFNQYFNILPGMEPAYREFLEAEFIPVMERLGIKVTNIWKAIIGSGPFINVEGTSPRIEEIAKTIATDEYRALTRTLKSRYVTDYQSRILAPTRRVEVPYFVKGLTAGL